MQGSQNCFPGAGALAVLMLLGICLPAAGAAPADRLAALESKFERTGEETTCLSLNQIDEVRVIDRQHLVFRVNLNKHYLNTLPRKCHALRIDSTLLIDTRTPELCDIDWVRVLQPFVSRALHARGPACGLGRFERLRAREPVPAD